MLYRGADILYSDEPTAVLTPQETERLFDVLRNMRADGKAIIIITHKLNEVLELSRPGGRAAQGRVRRRGRHGGGDDEIADRGHGGWPRRSIWISTASIRSIPRRAFS